MKFGPVTKLDKRNSTTSKKWKMTSCQKVVTSLTFLDFWPIWKPDSGCVVCNTYSENADFFAKVTSAKLRGSWC